MTTADADRSTASSTAARPWRARWRQLTIDTRPHIAGRRIDSCTDRTFDSIDPYDGSIAAKLPRCAADDVDRAVSSAHQAHQLGDWAFCSAEDRRVVLERFADLVDEHADELALLDSREMGMPIAQAVPDLHGAADALRDTAAHAAGLSDESLASAPGARAFNRRAPHGVMALITPWNFPAYIALGKVGVALAMGNSVVLKPSEVASLSCLRLADLATQAGVPPGVFNALPGLGSEAGDALARHLDVDALSFTGSTATGRRLMRAAGESNLKALILECGGKSPQVVFDDFGDPDALADALVRSFSWNSGQICVAGSRLLVHRSLLDALKPALVRQMEAAAAGLGDPLDEATTLGPLSSVEHWERVQAMVARAHDEGARSIADTPSARLTACQMRPIVLEDVTPEQPIVQEEVFGPVAVLMGFDSDDDALALANGTRYGLSATVWTADAAKAARFAQHLNAGFITVNASARPVDAAAERASGEAVGHSGFGAEGGLAGLQANSRARHLAFQS
jgi:acyl-CoA reductase-like NAD-dependent aldehyde dehydrogenase